MFTQEELKDNLHYDPDTGIFTWIKFRGGKASIGRLAGYASASRPGAMYWVISIGRRNYGAHRLAILYVTGKFPAHEVDHINGNGLDNRWVNLRAVTKTINSQNTKLQKNNKSGVCGVSWAKKSRSWVAQIKVNKVNIHLGLFKNLFDAVCARKNANIKYGFHRNHGLLR